MKKFLGGAALAVALIIGASGTSGADVSTNGTTRDAAGYCVANHNANFGGTAGGTGALRSVSKGSISDTMTNLPSICVDSQGSFAPISDNG